MVMELSSRASHCSRGALASLDELRKQCKKTAKIAKNSDFFAFSTGNLSHYPLRAAQFSSYSRRAGYPLMPGPLQFGTTADTDATPGAPRGCFHFYGGRHPVASALDFRE